MVLFSIIFPFNFHLDCFRKCGLDNPTWSELRHYVYFLSNQLSKFEASPYCGQAYADDLPGFRKFVLKFMFDMAKVNKSAIVIIINIIIMNELFCTHMSMFNYYRSGLFLGDLGS